MTCREKLAIEHPEKVNEIFGGGCAGCPDEYGYADIPEWCKPGDDDYCTKCWDREVETEVENGIKSSGEMTVFASGAVRDKKNRERALRPAARVRASAAGEALRTRRGKVWAVQLEAGDPLSQLCRFRAAAYA